MMTLKSRSRRPADTVQINLRIKESERRRLVLEAEKNGVSLNGEMAARLERSFEQRQLLTIMRMHDDMERNLGPLVKEDLEGLKRQGDLMRAASALIDRVQPLLATGVISGPEAEGTKQDIRKLQEVIKHIELEWVLRMRSMSTD